KERAARKLLASAQALGEDAHWTAELVEVVASLPVEESLPALRKKWSDYGLRDAITLVLATNPEAIDRAKFLDALASVQPHVVEEAATALRKISDAGSPEEMALVLQTLRQFCASPNYVSARRDLAALLNKWTGQEIKTTDSATATD